VDTPRALLTVAADPCGVVTVRVLCPAAAPPYGVDTARPLDRAAAAPPRIPRAAAGGVIGPTSSKAPATTLALERKHRKIRDIPGLQ